MRTLPSSAKRVILPQCVPSGRFAHVARVCDGFLVVPAQGGHRTARGWGRLTRFEHRYQDLSHPHAASSGLRQHPNAFASELEQCVGHDDLPRWMQVRFGFVDEEHRAVVDDLPLDQH